MDRSLPRASDRSFAARVRSRAPAVIWFASRPTWRNRLHWLSWALALTTELALVVLLQHGHIYGWEQSLTRLVQGLPGAVPIFVVSSTLTNTLSLGFLLILTGILMALVWLRMRTEAAILVLSFPLHVLAQFPKALIDRPRPSSEFDGIGGIGGVQSFPSGHAEYVVTFYGFLAYLAVRRMQSPWGRLAVVAGWLLFVFAVGFGRVATGRHWPLDVLASYVIGLGLLSGLIWLHGAALAAEKRPQDRAAAPPKQLGA